MRPRLLRGLAAWLVLVSLLASAYLAYGAQWLHRASRTDWPAAALGAQADATWNALAKCPLDTVAGNDWLAGLTVVYAPDRPSILIDGDGRYSPWITPQRLQANGALWLWQPGAQGQPPASPPLPLALLQPSANMHLHEGVWSIPWPHDPAGTKLAVHWRAYVPMACAR